MYRLLRFLYLHVHRNRWLGFPHYQLQDGVIATLRQEEAPPIAFGARGNYVAYIGGRLKIFDVSKKIEEESNSKEAEIDKRRQSPAITSSKSEILKYGPNTVLNIDNASGGRTPRPGETTARDMDHLHSRLSGVASKLGIEESFNQQYSSEAILSMQLLKEDISVVMRERAQKGYSMNVSEEITLKFKFYDQYNHLKYFDNFSYCCFVLVSR